MEKPVIRIYAFTDYREYLSAYYRAAKAANRRFSHRYIMAKVGAASTGWFADVLKGRINLTQTHRSRLASLLMLDRNESEYFESMINYAHASSHEERVRYSERMMSFREVRADLVGRDKFEYYNKWYHAVIRELLFVWDFHGDFKALSRKLNPPIRKKQAKESVALLLRLDLVREDSDGRLRPTVPLLKKDPTVKAMNLAAFMRSNMQLGIEALGRIDKDSRDISSLATPLSQADFGKAQEELKAWRKKLLAWSQNSPPGAKVYQCNFQIFPVTH